MSGIYIHGMEMPTNEEECKLFQGAPFRAPFCAILNVCRGLKNCPLIPVPDHGRLIDADALIEQLGDTEYKGAVKRVLIQAPTVIPADKEASE